MTGSTPWPIIILSLDGEDARRAPLLDRLAALGLSCEVYLGIDGRKGITPRWEAEIDRDAARRHLGRDMTNGEFACALSHREIYRRLLSEGWGGAVVLEDDAIIGPHFSAFMSQALYERAELLMLDHSHARVWKNAKDLLPGVQMYQLALPSCLTTAYAISRMAAKTLIETSTPVRRLADWPCGVTDLDAAVAIPQIVGHPDQNSGVSHLRQERIAAATHIKKKKLKKLSALLGFGFWRRWIIKRLSRRVS